MKKSIALIWLILTVTPLLLMPFSMFLITLEISSERTEFLRDPFYLSIISTQVLLIGLLVSYLIYLFRTSYVQKSKKALWVVVLLFANILAMPFFWYWYVWTPLNTNFAYIENDLETKSKAVPILIALLIVSIIPLTMFMDSWQESRSYEDLSNTFPIDSDHLDSLEISRGRVSISKKLMSKQSVYLHDVDVRISKASVIFTTSPLLKIFSNSFEIPVSAIHSCSKQCGGSTRYILIMDGVDTQISIEDAPRLLDWCWERKLPMLSSNSRREWLYKGTQLPGKDSLISELTTRKDYDYRSKRACQGY